ncbi:MAG: hypothetical protein EOO76_12115 [Novosphingobium sp.]|nr:MAG: hypothetical protein EOO76_12115 [Novosphingobium sp.]
MRHLLLPLLALVSTSPALADPLTITKTATVISDPLGYTATPRSLPGAVVDYKVLYVNPNANWLWPVRNIVSEDLLPANVILRVTDIATAGKGPVEFLDGSLLGTGLGGSGLSYTFTSLASTTDGIDFYNGTTWTYTPQPDAGGYDANVRGIRVRTTSTFNTGTQFQLRFRVKIR